MFDRLSIRRLNGRPGITLQLNDKAGLSQLTVAHRFMYRHDRSVIELIFDVLCCESRKFCHSRLPRAAGVRDFQKDQAGGIVAGALQVPYNLGDDVPHP